MLIILLGALFIGEAAEQCFAWWELCFIQPLESVHILIWKDAYGINIVDLFNVGIK